MYFNSDAFSGHDKIWLGVVWVLAPGIDLPMELVDHR